MTKKLKNIIALVIVLILLIGAYIYVKVKPSKTTSDTTLSSSTETQTAQLWKLDSNNIRKIEVTSKNGVLPLTENTSDKTWTVADVKYKLNTSNITTMANNIITLSGEVVEKEPQDISKYGLSKPENNAKVFLKDGSTKILDFGNKTSDGADYYVKVEGDKAVYIVEATTVDSLLVKLSDLRDKTLTAIDSTTLGYIKILRTGVQPIEITSNTAQSKVEAENSLNGLIMVKPYSYNVGVDSTNLATLTSGIASLALNDIVEDEAKDLSKYGLDHPTMDLTLKDSKNTLHLLVGNKVDDYNTYVKLPDSNTIYTMSTTVLTPFQVKPFDLIAKFADLITLTDVNKITVNGNGNNHNMVFTRTTKKATKTGESDETVTTYNVDNKDIKEDTFKTFYQELIGLLVDSEYDGNLKDNPEIRITYYMNNVSNKEEVLDFVPYNNDFYAVFKNGKSHFVIEKSKVTKVMESLKNLK